MKIPVKVLYASYLPKVKDRDKLLMAASGTNIGGNPPMRNLITSLPPDYLDNLEKIGTGADNGSPFPNYTPQGGADFNSLYPQRAPQPYTGPYNGSSDQMQPDTSNYHPAGPVQGFPGGISNENYVNPVINPNKDYKPHPYEGQVGQGILTAASAFDAILPYGRINRWPRVRPGLSPNQHPYGTGSQALMEYGGKMPNGGNTKKQLPNPFGNRYVAFPYGQAGTMPTTNTIDLNSRSRVNAINDRGYVNMYNSVDQFGNKSSLNDEQIPSQYLSPLNRNNFAVGSDSVYVAPGVDRTNVHIPMAYGGKIETAKSGNWLSGAVNPKHKGYCTPMTKSTCTPRRKAFAERAKHHNLADGGILEMPNGGITRGLIPQPTYNFTPGTNPNTSDSSMYLSNYNNLKAGDAGAMKMYNQLNMYGIPSTVSPDARTLALNQFNAYNDAAGRNIMTDQQVHDELYKPFAKPKDISSKKMAHGGGLSRSKDYGSKKHPYAMVKGKDFAGPHRSYPIPTQADAVDALRLAHLHHKPGVIAKVHKKYPNLKNGGPVGSGPITFPADHLGSSLKNGKWVPVSMKSGGSLTPSKAKEILHDGTAQGHPLTPKQRRFMGWKAGQKAPDGVTVPGTAQSTLNQANPTGEMVTPQSRGDAYMVDAINQMMITGQMSSYKGANPQERAIMNDAYVWRQANGQRNNGQQNIEGYFNRPVNPNNPTDHYRGRLAHIGQGAVSMYNSTPSLDVQGAQAPQLSYASMANGGPIYAEGGGIDTHWGGNAEPIAYNPYDGGTTQFNGDSHAEGGIGMSYNGKQVEVEGGETAAKDSEGNLNIFGNMRVPGTNVKFKTASKEIADKEQKFDKLKTDGTATVNTLDPMNKYDQIKFNAGQLMMQGGDMGQKELAKRKQQLADLQNAMLETARVHNLDPQGMSQGNLKKAKKGMWMKKADGGPVKEGDEPIKDWAYYQKIIDANTKAVKQGEGMNDATYNDLLANTKQARSAQAALKGPGPKDDGLNDPTRADRNMNPGNIKYGPNAKKYGATGKDKDGFAIFPDRQTGATAMQKLLTEGTDAKGNPLYSNLDVNTAIHNWTGNHPYKYTLPEDIQGKKISELSPEQLQTLTGIMSKGEGTRYGAPQVKAPTTPLAGTPNITPNVGFGLPNVPAFTPDPKTAVPTQPTVPIRSLSNVPTQRPIPTQAKPLGFNDVASDIFAIAQNHERPVYAQRYNPQLYQPYQVSFQDRLNDNNESFNNIERLVGSTNPTALGALAGQKYSADNAVRADEFRTNQGISNQVYNENIGLMNDAQWRNIGIADQQFTRQDLANSKTREMNQLIANDLSNKYNQVKMRNNELRAYENLYNFRLQPNEQGGLSETNYNPEQQFDFSGQNGTGREGNPNIRRINNYTDNGKLKNYRTVEDSPLKTENEEELLEERRRKNSILPYFHGGSVRKRYKPIRL